MKMDLSRKFSIRINTKYVGKMSKNVMQNSKVLSIIKVNSRAK
jgi:hypothetical protein